MACKIEIRNTINSSIDKRIGDNTHGVQQTHAISAVINKIWEDNVTYTTQESDFGGYIYKIIKNEKIIDKVVDKIYNRQESLEVEKTIEESNAYKNEDGDMISSYDFYDNIYSNNQIYGSQDLNIRKKYFVNSEKSTDRIILKQISNSNHPLNKLAKQLIPYSKNIPIILKPVTYLDNKNSAGLAYGSSKIEIAEFARFKGKGSEITILHEIIHILSLDYLTNADKNSLLYKEYINLFNIAKKEFPNEYGTSNSVEFITELFTNAEFIKKLQSITSDKTEFSNLFEELLNYFLNLFNINKKNSLYENAFAVATNIIKQDSELNYNNNILDSFDLNELSEDYYILKEQEEKNLDYGTPIETPIKEGVAFVFESNPELANIGTKEQYSQYLESLNKPNTNPVLQGNQQDNKTFLQPTKEQLKYIKPLPKELIDEINRLKNKSNKEILTTIKFYVEVYKEDKDLAKVVSILLENVDKIKFVKFKGISKLQNPNNQAEYNGETGEIFVNDIAYQPNNIDLQQKLYETIVHEYLHGFFLSVLNTPKTKEETDLVEYITDVYEILKEEYTGTEKHYGFKNIDEFVSELLSNKTFRESEQVKKTGIIQKILQFLNGLMFKHLGKNSIEIKQNAFNKILDSITIIKPTLVTYVSKVGSSLNNQQEQVKKFTELQERLNNKEFIEGAKFAYEGSEGLQKNGTQEQYNDYIARVSLGILKNPSSGGYNYTSKVKDIVYRGGNITKEEFNQSEHTPTDYMDLGNGLYLSPKLKIAQEYGNVRATIVNIKNPNDANEVANQRTYNFQNNKHQPNKFDENGKFDGIIDLSKNLKDTYEMVVFDLSQIHVLGNKQDIEGFKIWQNNQGKNLKYQQVTQDKPNIQEAIDYIKSIVPKQEISLIEGFIDNIGKGSYNSLTDLITLSNKYANKKTAKHEIFHKAFNLAPKELQEQLLNEGAKRFNLVRGKSTITTKYSQVQQNEINYVLRAVDILQSQKGDEIFRKGDKNNWDIDKILTELNIPKEQKELIKSFNTRNREDILTSLLANYSFSIEINTAKEKQNIGYEQDEDGIYLDDSPRFINDEEGKATQYYSNLTVPGGTNYTENEISTPLITPSIKGHAQFSTDNGIGWFRSDDRTHGEQSSLSHSDKVEANGEWDRQDEGFSLGNDKYTQTIISEVGVPSEFWDTSYKNGVKISNDEYYEAKRKSNISVYKNEKTRRILEVQSDLFQKSRDKEELSSNNPWDDIEQKNQFLQLLNKDNNWVTFFVKSIIQDSAKKGYEKVLFPTGNTASKVEGHSILEEFKKQKEDRIKDIERDLPIYKRGKVVEKNNAWYAVYDKKENRFLTKQAAENEVQGNIDVAEGEINQLKQELERVETEGFGALKPIYNFYENTVTNILKKQGYNSVLITDEYGNTWNEVKIKTEHLESIKFQSPKLEYKGDLAIEEKIAEMMENTPDKQLPKTVLGRWIQSIRNFFRNIFKERDKISQFLRDTNQGKTLKESINSSQKYNDSLLEYNSNEDIWGISDNFEQYYNFKKKNTELNQEDLFKSYKRFIEETNLNGREDINLDCI